MDDARGAGQIGGEKRAFGGVGDQRQRQARRHQPRRHRPRPDARTREFVNNSLSIPYLVEGPVFTALSMEATDEGGLADRRRQAAGARRDRRGVELVRQRLRDGQDARRAGQGALHAVPAPVHRRAEPAPPAQDQRARRPGCPTCSIDPIGQPWAQANLGPGVHSCSTRTCSARWPKSIPGAPGLAQTPTDYGETFRSRRAPAPTPTAAPAATLPGLTPPASPRPRRARRRPLRRLGATRVTARKRPPAVEPTAVARRRAADRRRRPHARRADRRRRRLRRCDPDAADDEDRPRSSRS